MFSCANEAFCLMGTVDGRCGIPVSSNMASRGPVGRDCRRCWSMVEGWWDSIVVEMQVEFGNGCRR